jgi:hypothetical protein
MKRDVAVVEGSGSEMEKFSNEGEEQMNEQTQAPRSLVLGRAVRSAKYGAGFVSAIEDDAVTVRFWKDGYKTFYKGEAGYPFQLLDKIRTVEKKSTVEIVLSRETPLEKKERTGRCSHGKARLLCLTCAGISANDAKKWNRLRSSGRRHEARGLASYTSTRISQSDCVLVSRSDSTLPAKEISDWYQCRHCYSIFEMPCNKPLPECPRCRGQVEAIAEPFQRTNFSPYIGNGADEESYVAAYRKCEKVENVELRGLYRDPNSGFQKGGTGYLRIPLSAARGTRAAAPAWLHFRENFTQTLRPRRAARAERILCGFYVDGMTDKQIAESEDWTKDAIKKERHYLLRSGTDFFRSLLAEHPPSPAINEKHHQRHLRFSLRLNQPQVEGCIQPAMRSNRRY